MDRFEKFYTESGGRLYSYLLRRCGSPQLAADLVQETFTRYLERYKHREYTLALLFTIGRNLFYDHVRNQGRVTPLHDEPAEMSPGVEKAYDVQENSRKVLASMQQLGEEERDVLALVVSSGLTYCQIAEIRGCSEANIKIKVHRARQKLRDLLQ